MLSRFFAPAYFHVVFGGLAGRMLTIMATDRPRIPFIEQLCKQLPELEILEAEANFWSYLDIVKRTVEQSPDKGDFHTSDSTKVDSDSRIQSPGAESGPS
jgi:hypothetical protein